MLLGLGGYFTRCCSGLTPASPLMDHNWWGWDMPGIEPELTIKASALPIALSLQTLSYMYFKMQIFFFS